MCSRFLKIFHIQDESSVNKNDITSSFPECPFFFFLAYSPCCSLKYSASRNVTADILVLFLSLWCSLWGPFIHGLYHLEKVSVSSRWLRMLLMKGIGLTETCFPTMEWHVIFVFCSIDMLYKITDFFQTLNQVGNTSLEQVLLGHACNSFFLGVPCLSLLLFFWGRLCPYHKKISTHSSFFVICQDFVMWFWPYKMSYWKVNDYKLFSNCMVEFSNEAIEVWTFWVVFWSLIKPLHLLALLGMSVSLVSIWVLNRSYFLSS